jgi:hypothetical protein
MRSRAILQSRVLVRGGAIRRVCRVLVTAAIVMSQLALSTRAQEIVPPGGAVFTGDTFVGEHVDPSFLIAIIVGPVEAETATRPARAYLCDGTLGDLWFVGSLTGEQLTLQRQETANGDPTLLPAFVLKGTVQAAGVAGEAVLGDQVIPFETVPATGVGGYWEGVWSAGGLVLAKSSTGAQYMGLAPAMGTTTASGPPFLIDGTATLVDGAQLPLTLRAPEPVASVFHTVVVDGEHECDIHPLDD